MAPSSNYLVSGTVLWFIGICANLVDWLPALPSTTFVSGGEPRLLWQSVLGCWKPTVLECSGPPSDLARVAQSWQNQWAQIWLIRLSTSQQQFQLKSGLNRLVSGQQGRTGYQLHDQPLAGESVLRFDSIVADCHRFETYPIFCGCCSTVKKNVRAIFCWDT